MRPTAQTSLGPDASAARSSLTELPGLGASAIVHSVPSQRWIATAEGASGSPAPPTAQACLAVTAATPRSVVGVSGMSALSTSSNVGVQSGAAGEVVVAVGVGSVSSSSEPVARIAVDPTTNVSAAAITPLIRPLR